MPGFGRDRRIRRRADFVRIQKTGRPVRTRHFVMLVAAREEDGPSRLGVVAARSTGGAVVRNRIKRLCRESFRLASELVPDGIDLVVIARAGAGDLGLRDVQAEWSGATPRLREECNALRDTRRGKKVRKAEPE